MAVFIIRRLLQAVFVVLAMSMIVFVGVNAVGDPVHMFVSPDAPQEEIERVIRQFGLDRPVWEQYGLFMQGALAGDLGNSYVFGTPALSLILDRAGATFELAFVSLMIAVAFGIPLGLYAGLHPDSRLARGIMATSILGFSLPTFWVGLVMIIVFAVELGIVPSTGRGDVATFMWIESSIFTLDGLSHILLPATNLALLNLSLVIRLTRAGVREAWAQDYIKFARAKGLTERRIVNVHLMKNILIPVVTVLGLEFGSLIAFSVVTETIFSWPGMGSLLIESILVLDRPVIVAYLMMIVLIFVIINLVVDILYSILDPRVRLSEQGS
ncbi:MAG: ABC transporter permease [Pseudomonadota bacterium]